MEGKNEIAILQSLLQEEEAVRIYKKVYAYREKSKNAIYQLMDNYTLFYFDFIQKNTNQDEHFGQPT